MKHGSRKRALAGVTSLAMLTTSLSAIMSVQAAGETEILVTGFEDGEGVSEFTGRGGVEVIEATTEVAHSGDSCMCVSGREESWNGPQLLLDERCEPMTEYLVSAWVKTDWYSTINLSMEYTDTEGTRHYGNLATAQGDGWTEFKDVKASFTEDMTNVYIYFESSDAACSIYIDDFSLKEAPVIAIEDDIPSLQEVYADAFKVGTAITNNNLASKSFMSLVQKHFGASMTAGNELKPESLLDKAKSQANFEETGDDTVPAITLSNAKGLLNYCRDNNVPMRGHCLVWHSQTPDWFFKEGFADDGDWVSKEVMIDRMESYIKQVMEALATEYPTVDFYAWDVVNEAWTDSGEPRAAGAYSEGNGSSAWVKVFGDNSFIEYAFTFARKYAPTDCKLYYNDYNEYMTQKTDAMIKMATDLKEKGLIDGLGMQSHLDVGFPSAAMYKAALAKFAETGLDVQVTELDITTSDTSETGLKKQAQMYSDIFDALYEYKDSISAVILWGVTDPDSWRASQVPLLFDGEYQAKPAFFSIVDGIEYTTTEKKTTTTRVTTTTTTTTVTGGEATLLGDVNVDGIVSIADVVMLARYVSQDTTLEPIGKTGIANADCDGDDGLTADDISLLSRFLANLVDALG